MWTSVLAFLVLACSICSAEDKIGALGRIEPPGGLVQLAGPPGDVVAEIAVREGEYVKKGAALVVFESRVSRELELSQARAALREADELGSKAIALQELKVRETVELGRISLSTQEQRVVAADAEHDFALKRQSRYEGIDGQTLSAQQMDERRSQVTITQAKLVAARSELDRLRLGNELGASSARQELGRLVLNREIAMSQARTKVDLAGERLKQSILRAPKDGTVLEIHAKVGEATGGRPMVTMAHLDPMYVTAEVFEGDLSKISVGMKATITGSALSGTLNGEVETVGRVIAGSSRTGKVRIRLLDSKAASKLINMEVDVSIKI